MTCYEQKAVELFRKGCNCSQAVFAAFSDVTGIDESTAIKMSAPFGGGLGRLREVCGAVSGMSLAAGCLWGYNNLDNKEQKTEHYKLISGMANRFADIMGGTYICRDILKLTDSTYSPVAEERTAEYYSLRPCERCVAVAAGILEEELKNRK